MKAKSALSGLYQQCDEGIWIEFRKGNQEAFSILYYRYSKILFQNGLKISGDRDLIKDCIHDLFMEIWTNRLKMVVPDCVTGYLISCLQRKVFRHVKKNQLWKFETGSLPELECVHSKEDQMINEQSTQEQVSKVGRALNALTKRQKEAVYLKFYSNLSYAEIAAMMSISTDSTYNLVSKAIANLQQELRKEVCFH